MCSLGQNYQRKGPKIVQAHLELSWLGLLLEKLEIASRVLLMKLRLV